MLKQIKINKYGIIPQAKVALIFKKTTIKYTKKYNDAKFKDNTYQQTTNHKKLVVKKLPLATYVLSFWQSINFSIAIISVTVASVVGLTIAPSPELASIPYGAQFLALSFLLPILLLKLCRKQADRKFFTLLAGYYYQLE